MIYVYGDDVMAAAREARRDAAEAEHADCLDYLADLNEEELEAHYIRIDVEEDALRREFGLSW